jgi:chloramphenicol 3-O phosphotransferase
MGDGAAGSGEFAGPNVEGRIVVLNGTSSAGKTTIVQALQADPQRTWLASGIDHIIPTVPPHLLVAVEDTDAPPVAGWLLPYQDGRLVARPKLGPVAMRILDGIYRSVVALASAGNDVVVDDVMYGAEVRALAARTFAGRPAWLVRIECPIEVAVAREAARGDRAPGGASLFAETVHDPPIYDLELDTSLLSADECAERITRMLDTITPQAFSTLAST